MSKIEHWFIGKNSFHTTQSIHKFDAENSKNADLIFNLFNKAYLLPNDEENVDAIKAFDYILSNAIPDYDDGCTNEKQVSDFFDGFFPKEVKRIKALDDGFGKWENISDLIEMDMINGMQIINTKMYVYPCWD